MAKSRFIQNSFTSGVLSPLLKGRTDIDQYYQGLEVGKNWVLLPQGGIKRRPGTPHVDAAEPILTKNNTTPTAPNGDGNLPARINDGDESTVGTTSTAISTLNPYVVARYDLSTPTQIELVDIRGLFITSGTSDEFKIQYSTDDTTYVDAVDIPVIGTNAQNFRFHVGVEARYWRLARIGSTDLTTATVSCQEFNLLEKSSALSEVKLKDFSVESDRHYLLVFTEGNCAIYRKSTNTRVADIKMPYTSSQVKNVRDVQTESVMLLFHEDHPTQRLINLGNDSDWLLDNAPYINVPQFDYNDDQSPTPSNEVQTCTFTGFTEGDTFQIDVEGVLSKNITFAGDSSAAERESTAFNMQKNLQDMPTFGETGVSVARTGTNIYTITVSGESAKDFKLFSGFATSGTASKTMKFASVSNGSPRAEDVWSATRGYPKTACFYEGRLVIGGTKSKPQSLFMSKAGIAFDFDIDEGDDDDAIFTTIASRKLNDIVDVFPGRNLQIFTSGSEFTVNVSPVTPQTITVTPQTSHGALNLEAKEIDGATIFADRNGKSLKEYVFSFNEDAYTTNDTSVLSPELIRSPVDIAILGGTAADDANWVFIVNADGGATVLNTLRSQDINGFTQWTTAGQITDVSVVDDELYMVNKRNVNGSDIYHVERWSFDYLMDDSIKITHSAPLDTISDLDYLEGLEVSIVADGSVLPARTVSNGSITIASNEQQHTNFEIGLLFVPELRPMPINSNAGSGQNQMRLKKIVRTNIRVNGATGVYVEGQPIPVRQFGDSSDSPLDTPPEEKTGIIEDFFGEIGWSRYDLMPAITLPDPTPCTILSIGYEVESS